MSGDALPFNETNPLLSLASYSNASSLFLASSSLKGIKGGFPIEPGPPAPEPDFEL
jgi:hypothetical protein